MAGPLRSRRVVLLLGAALSASGLLIQPAKQRSRVCLRGFFDGLAGAFANENPETLRAIGDDVEAVKRMPQATLMMSGDWVATMKIEGAATADRSSELGGPKVRIRQEKERPFEQVLANLTLRTNGTLAVEPTRFTTGVDGSWSSKAETLTLTLSCSGFSSGFSTKSGDTTLYEVPAGDVLLRGDVTPRVGGVGVIYDGTCYVSAKSGFAGTVLKKCGTFTANQISKLAP